MKKPVCDPKEAGSGIPDGAAVMLGGFGGAGAPVELIHAVPAVGGAMDLVSGVKSVFILMEHVTRDGIPKLVERCSYPMTGAGVVHRIFTDLAVIDVTPDGFAVREIMKVWNWMVSEL